MIRHVTLPAFDARDPLLRLELPLPGVATAGRGYRGIRRPGGWNARGCAFHILRAP